MSKGVKQSRENGESIQSEQDTQLNILQQRMDVIHQLKEGNFQKKKDKKTTQMCFFPVEPLSTEIQ